MPVMRQAVGERWAVVEHVFRCAVAMRDAGAERVVGSPVVEDVEFERREFRRSGCGLRVGGHCGALSPVPYVAGFAAPEALCRWLRGSGSLMSLASQLRQLNVRHGDDVAPVRERRGTTPLAHSRVRRSNAGDDGPNRSGLLGWISAVLPKAPR